MKLGKLHFFWRWEALFPELFCVIHSTVGTQREPSSGWGSGTHEAAVISASAKSSPNRPNVQGNRGTRWHPLVYRHRDRLCQRWELHLCFPSASQHVILESPSSEYGRTPKVLKSYSELWCTPLPIVQCITHTNGLAWCLLSIYPGPHILQPHQPMKLRLHRFISCFITKSILLW